MKTTPARPAASALARRLAHALCATACALALAACSANYPAAHLPPSVLTTQPAAQAFVMPDGARLPYRQWLPAPHPPEIVVLALHGFNDSADGWELPAPTLAAAGIAVFAPDQRGFGTAPERGRWPGTDTLASDAAAMAAQLTRQYPTARLYLMGESMGGAILMHLAASPQAPRHIAGYVLIAPAVWGRAQLNPALRATLFLANALVPGLSLSPGPVRVRASDNREALIRLSQDPRTLIRTRVAAVAGLVDLMTDAQRAAPAITAPTLCLYGAHDELIPKPATLAAWRNMPAAQRAYYADGYHLLLRDQSRAIPTTDLIAWLRHPGLPLPSGADRAARQWQAAHNPSTRPRSALATPRRTRSSAG